MSTGRDIILQHYREGGKAIRMKRTSKKTAAAHYVRVSVKDLDDQAAKPKADLSQLSDEELGAGLYIPEQERFFRNSPDDYPSQAEFILADYLRQKEKMKKITAEIPQFSSC